MKEEDDGLAVSNNKYEAKRAAKRPLGKIARLCAEIERLMAENEHLKRAVQQLPSVSRAY